MWAGVARAATPSPPAGQSQKPKKAQLGASAATDLTWPDDDEWYANNHDPDWWKRSYSPEEWADWNRMRAYNHAQNLFGSGASPVSPATTVDPWEVIADKQEKVATLKAMLASLDGKTDTAETGSAIPRRFSGLHRLLQTRPSSDRP